MLSFLQTDRHPPSSKGEVEIVSDRAQNLPARAEGVSSRVEEVSNRVEGESDSLALVAEVQSLRKHKEWADKKIDQLIKRVRESEGPQRLLTEEVQQLRLVIPSHPCLLCNQGLPALHCEQVPVIDFSLLPHPCLEPDGIKCVFDSKSIAMF